METDIITFIIKIRNKIQIQKLQMKFMVTPKKCKYYINIHFPEINATQLQIKRCSFIFYILLRKVNGFELDEGNKNILWREERMV